MQDDMASPSPPAVVEPIEAPPSQGAPAQRAAASDDLTVVIDPGGEETRSEASRTTLLEASAAERARRRTSPPPSIVITNENLAEHATGGLTVVGGTARRQGAEDGIASGSEAPETEAGEKGEAYWRQRVGGVRLEWHQTLEEIDHLQERVTDFRRRFYAEDDPYYRDTQIKPSWDRTLERLEEARKAEEGYRERLNQILEEGRRAGALPGWLREGIELEPDPPAERGHRERLPEHKPQEPVVVDDDVVGSP